MTDTRTSDTTRDTCAECRFGMKVNLSQGRRWGCYEAKEVVYRTSENPTGTDSHIWVAPPACRMFRRAPEEVTP